MPNRFVIHAILETTQKHSVSRAPLVKRQRELLPVSWTPKYSVAEVIGFIKGKSSIWIAQNVERKARNFTGHRFWARGYFVSTVGRDEEIIRAYIKNQELQDREMDQLALIP